MCSEQFGTNVTSAEKTNWRHKWKQWDGETEVLEDSGGRKHLNQALWLTVRGENKFAALITLPARQQREKVSLTRGFFWSRHKLKVFTSSSSKGFNLGHATHAITAVWGTLIVMLPVFCHENEIYLIQIGQRPWHVVSSVWWDVLILETAWKVKSVFLFACLWNVKFFSCEIYINDACISK